MEQSSGRSWVFVGISSEVSVVRDGAPPNKGKHLQTRGGHLQTRKKIPFKQEKPQQARKRLSSKGYLPIKCKSLQVVGVSRQGKAVVSDGGYGVIGGGYCLLVWGDAEGTKGKRGRRWRGVGPAGRPSLFPSGVSVILKI